jgi:predicted MFS family arabinose efflux permease
MSRFEFTTTLGLALGGVGGSLLWGWLGRPAFVLVGGLYLLSALLFWLVRDADELGPGSAARRPPLHREILGVLCYRPLLRFAPAWLAVNAVVGLWLNHAIFQMSAGHSQPGQYLVGAFDSRQLAAILGGYTLVFGVGVLAWGYLLGRLGELGTMRLTLGGMLGAAAMIGVMNHSGGPGPLLWLGVGLFVITVLIESGFPPAAVSYLARLSSDLARDRGLFMGLYSVVLGIGQILGSGLGGPFADRWGMDGVLLLTFILGLAALGLTWTLGSNEASPAP